MWYNIQAVYKIKERNGAKKGTPARKSFYEFRVILINAKNKLKAEAMARKMAKESEGLELVKIVEIEELGEEIEEGMELFGKLFVEEELQEIFGENWQKE